MVRFVVRIQSVVQPRHGPWRVDTITIDNLKDELVQQGLSINDFIYYTSMFNMLNPTGRRMRLIELTDQTTFENMVEDYNARQSVELNCYRRPNWFVEPALSILQKITTLRARVTENYHFS